MGTARTTILFASIFFVYPLHADPIPTHATLDESLKAGSSRATAPFCNTLLEAKSSGGQGGQTGNLFKSFTDSQGLTGAMRLSVPKDIHSEPRGVLFYLTGDTGKDLDTHWNSIAALAARLGLMAVSIRPPLLQGEKMYRWWTNATAKAKFLNDAIDSLKKSYPLDLNRMIFSGASGGSTFLNGYFIPKHATQYGGGAVSLCGGYLNSIHQMKLTPGFQQNFPIKMAIGERDFLLNNLNAGAIAANRVLSSAGFRVDFDLHRGNYGHCQFKKPMTAVLEEKVGEILATKKQTNFSGTCATPSEDTSRQSQFVSYRPETAPPLARQSAAPEARTIPAQRVAIPSTVRGQVVLAEPEVFRPRFPVLRFLGRLFGRR